MMKNIVCWERELISRVMHPEAVRSDDDHLFLATHHPIVMRRMDRYTGESGRELLRQEQFRQEFLALPDHALVVIQGASGSGKSHLIRWLYAKTPRTENRRVVLIPRSGTNLKGVIERILAGLKGPPFDEYRQRLEKATGHLTPGLAAERLLHHLAEGTGPHGPFSSLEEDDDEKQDMRDYLVANLPGLLDDASIRKKLLAPGSLLDEMAQHAVGERRGDPMEQPFEFTPADFDVAGWGIHTSDLNVSARRFFGQLLSTSQMLREAIAWLNMHCEWAIRQLLAFSGEDLARLLRDVRVALKEQGQELVLLIEDFAKCQGIEGQLLDAVQERADVHPELCTLRAALAMTSGYGNVVETVRTRVDLLVDLDVEMATQARVNDGEKIARFSARYLNAIRVGEDSLQQWHRAAGPEDLDSHPVPNACDDCAYRNECHAAFGAVDGFGLYPFNGAALDRMAELKVLSRGGQFIPRFMLNDVLKYVLLNHTREIEDGEFPPAALRLHFGEHMPVSSQATLREAVRGEFERYRALYEYWGDRRDLTGIPEALFQAFDLAPPSLTSAVIPVDREFVIPDRTREKPRADVDAETGGLPRLLAQQLDALDHWANGAILSGPLAQRLREVLYEVLVSHIDWNSEMLVRQDYAGATKAFRPTSINFHRQQTQAQQPPVRLTLPLREDDYGTTVLALRALLLYRHFGHWRFENGGRHLRAYAERLTLWSEEVLAQLRRSATEQEVWDPVPAIVELLAVGARMNGRPRPSEEGLENQVDSLFLSWQNLTPEDGSPRTRTWRELAKQFSVLGGPLREIMEARIACTKGRASDSQVIDAAGVAWVLRRRAWRPAHRIPDVVRPEYRPIKQLRDRVDAQLDTAIAEETRRYLDWHEEVTSRLGETTTPQELAEVVVTVARKADKAGMWRPIPLDAVETAAKEFRRRGVDTVLRAAGQLREEEPGRRLVTLGRADLANPMESASSFLKSAEACLDATSRRVAEAVATLSGDVASLERNATAIATGLEKLCQITGELAGGDDAA